MAQKLLTPAAWRTRAASNAIDKIAGIERRIKLGAAGPRGFVYIWWTLDSKEIHDVTKYSIKAKAFTDRTYVDHHPPEWAPYLDPKQKPTITARVWLDPHGGLPGGESFHPDYVPASYRGVEVTTLETQPADMYDNAKLRPTRQKRKSLDVQEKRA